MSELKKPLVKTDDKTYVEMQSKTADDEMQHHSDDVPAEERLAKFNPNGLTSGEAAQLLAQYGRNELEEKKAKIWELLLRYFWGQKIWKPDAIIFVMWVAAILSVSTGSYPDFGVVVGLIIVNGCIAWYENAKAGNAVAALRAALSPRAFVKRDGTWGHIDAAELVPGDLISLKIGDICPADCVMCEGGTMDIDQSGLTGESLPVEKRPGQTLYSGTTVKRGENEAFVESTGANTEFGKTAKLIQSVESIGNFQKVLERIAYFLIVMAVILVTVMIIVEVVVAHVAPSQVVTQGLILLVATVPVGQVVVCTATMAVGARRLAAENAVVTRLSAVEELAGMTVLCSDKTGTLTQNVLTVDKPWTIDESISADDILFAAALACKKLDPDAIDTAMIKFCPNKERLADFEQVEFIPFDPSNRKTEATLRNTLTGEVFKVQKGAPRNVLAIAVNRPQVEAATSAVISDFARRGLRSLGVARTLPGRPDDEWHFMGILSLFDPPRHDTKEVIENALSKGVSVKMITGDHLLIAKETARRLGMGSNILQAKSLHDKDRSLVADLAVQVDGFAEVFPEDKFDIVAMIQEKGNITGMTGDGVNDAPALKKAHVGFAVHGATPAAQGAASVVLSTPGLSVIITAIIRSRKIFQRMSNYASYRINVSLQLLFFFFFAIVIFNFHLPSILILLMALLNDFTVLSIAYDKVFPAQEPDTWRVWQLSVRALSMSAVSAAGTLLMLQAVETNFGVCPLDQYPLSPVGPNQGLCANLNFLGQPRLLSSQIRAVMFLQVALPLQVTVFIARTNGPFFTRRPGFVLLAAILAEMFLTTMLAMFWPGNPVSLAPNPRYDPTCVGATCPTQFIDDEETLWGCGGPWTGIVYVWSVIIVLVADIVKCLCNVVIRRITLSDKNRIASLQEEVRRVMAKRPHN